MRPDRVLRVDGGLVSGLATEQGDAWLGIPFAAPPVGPLRWRPPQAVLPWAGVRACDRYGDACLQPPMHAHSLMAQFSFEDPPECGVSEDCLYLNVWAPPQAEGPLPVIVFLYGGGHRHGSGSHPVSRGEHLAAKGAIVVTVNYRVGALGYLAHPALTAESGASGHWAGLDVLAALGWVRRNIAVFGGDPERVTLFGQSAGAALVNVLMASPLARGLFQRAIVHSSGRFAGAPPLGATMKTLAQAEQAGAALVPAVRTADELRALDPLAIEAPRGFWGPIVDGQLLPATVEEVFRRGEQLPVALLAGFTRDEASAYPNPELHTRAAFEAHALRTFGTGADRLLALYPVDSDAAAIAASYALRRDSTFAFQPWRCARLQAATTGSPVYLFEFAQPLPLPADAHFDEPRPPQGYGASHGAELWYVFGNVAAQPWPWSAADRQLADRMGAAWVAFARDGNPDIPGLPHWPDFRAAGEALTWSETPRVERPSDAEALAFFEVRFE